MQLLRSTTVTARCSAIAAAALAAALAAAATGSARVDATVTRLVDRTYACDTEDFGGGYRRGDLDANPRLPNGAPAGVRFTAGREEGAAAVGALADGGFGQRAGGVYVTTGRCRLTRLRVALSPAGLEGGATALGTSYECELPRRVVVRIRAVLRSVGRWHPIEGSGGAAAGVQVDVREAALAVRTLASPKPFAFASFDARRRAYASARVCTER